MLRHPSLEKLCALRLRGMAQAFEEQLNAKDMEVLTFEERFGLLVDREMTEREDRRMKTRLRQAKLRHNAVVEDIDYRHPRGLDKSLMSKLVTCQWVRAKHNVLITGPTGIGKSWLACALAHKVCRDGLSGTYMRVPRLLQELDIARGDGRYPKVLSALAKKSLLVLDDWGQVKLNGQHRQDLLEIMEDRCGVSSTLVTSQLPPESWHEAVGDPTLADAILDRLVHNAYRLDLEGESMRKKKSKLTNRKRSR